MKNTILFVICLFLMPLSHWAQTTTVVYFENFNSGTGGWQIGGFHPSWSYGIPSLPNIASNGTNCFSTGDAGAASTEPFAGCLPVTTPTTSGNYYNCCERSYVESPIINLSGIFSPMLSLDINLHCEQTFDGAKMQISLNGGSSWQDIGAYTSSTYQVFPNALNCREKNWYNKNNINYLTGTSGGCGIVNYSFGGGNSGWSGGCALAASGACSTNDNHGTNGWVTASLCIPQAANQSSVMVRIAFGSGSQVYSDGIAFDNVKITNVYPVVNFTGNQNPGCGPSYEFINNTDCAQSWNWNFGHPGFPGNTSTSFNPIHEFPAPGNYTVSLTATDFCGGTASFGQQITVNPGNAPLIASVEQTETLLCDSASGVITITLSPTGTPPYNVSYSFNTTPFSLTGLTGNPILITGLYPGNYSSFSITDANGCNDQNQALLVLPYNDDSLSIHAYGDTLINPGTEAQLIVTANIPSTFLWSPANTLNDPFSNGTVASPLETTAYTVTATDTNGCIATASVTVFVKDDLPCNQYFFPNSFTPNGDGKNERFHVYVGPEMNLVSYTMVVYNRWGKEVFTTMQVADPWTGTGEPLGVYTVVADFGCKNKTRSRYTGVINLIR